MVRPEIRLTVGLSALSASFASLVLIAQTPPAQAPTFRSGVDLVQVDVSVLDKDRRPVRGLSATDFTVLEDGKPQKIAIFEPVEVPDPELQPVEWMRDVTPDVTTNETKITRYWVVAVDDALIPGADPWIVKSAKQIVRDIIDQLGPEDLATIVFTADSRQAQDFTNDRTKLLATLDKFAPSFAIWTAGADTKRGFDPDVQFMLGSIDTVRNALDALALIPNTRKTLIWVTPGVPVDFEMAGPVVVPNPPKNDDQNMMGVMSHRHLIDRTKEILAAAKRANVPIYPIDPCGLGGLQAPPQKVTRAQDHVVLTAANTGGRTVLNTNSFKQGIEDIFEENASYYLIGYNPTNTNADGTVRRIDVKVNRPGAEVRTRSEYVAPKPGAAVPMTANAMLAKAVAGPVPVRDLPLRATVVPFAIPGGGNAAVVIALGVRQPVPPSAAKGRTTVTTELQTSAYTMEGDLRGTQRHTAKVQLRAGAEGDADYEALSRIDLPPGRYRLRIAASLGVMDKTGTVQVDVIVPDFNRDVASMSGVVISASPGRPSAPRDLFRDILATVPTAQRSFGQKDQVTALFDLYQNAGKPMAPAQVAIRIVDALGAAVGTDDRTLAIDQFIGAQSQQAAQPSLPVTGGGKSMPTMTPQSRPLDQGASVIRAAEVRYALPLDRLAAGRYLVTFEATIGAAKLRRDVQFEVR